MRIEEVQAVAPKEGLSALDQVVLGIGCQRLLDWCAAACGGTSPWRHRKWAEARELLALSQIAVRLKVLELDLRETFRALVKLRVPVPCVPGAAGAPIAGDGLPRVEAEATLGITYEQKYVYEPAPGYAFVTILEPAGVWHPNVAMHPAQALCLGAKLPAAIPVKELVLLSYAALAMQSHSLQMDERAPEGVLNVEAARWWQQHHELVPLSRTPFLLADGQSPGGAQGSHVHFVQGGRARNEDAPPGGHVRNEDVTPATAPQRRGGSRTAS